MPTAASTHAGQRTSPLVLRGVLVIFVATGLGALAADPPVLGDLSLFALVAAAALVAGELLPARVGRRVVAPVSTAASLAMATTPALARTETVSALRVVGILWVCFVIGWLASRLLMTGGRDASMPARFFGVATTALLCRGVPVGGHDSLLAWVESAQLSRPAAAVLLLVAAALGGLVERVADVLITWRVGERRLAAVLRAELGPVSMIGAAVVATAPLISLTEPIIGVVALPLFLLPVSMVLLALRRYLAVQRTQEEMLTALARLPEIAAGGRPGHPLRVAALSVAVARQLGLGERQQRVVERTALLHDIGQVGLQVPLARGVTLDAPAPQIEDMGASARQIIAHSVALPDLSHSIVAVHTPYRTMQQLGEELPPESRIVRVVNAFDDLTEGAEGQRVVALALERLHLGLGYEYDPEVVDALERVVLGSSGAARQP